MPLPLWNTPSAHRDPSARSLKSSIDELAKLIADEDGDLEKVWKAAMLDTFIHEYHDGKLELLEGLDKKVKWERMEERLAHLKDMLEKRKHVGRVSRLLAPAVSIHSA